MQKVDILAIGAHPDDIELGCSGTLLKYIQEGKKVGLLDLTQGELGTRGNAELRAIEARDAALKMKATFRIGLDLPDGFFDSSMPNLLKVIEVIRYCQPSIVLANALYDRHPDHGKGADLAAKACFLSGLEKVQTNWDEQPQKKWRPTSLFHYLQDDTANPHFIIDISSFWQQKMELILTFRSQFYDPDSSEANTPISGKDFLEFLEAKAKVIGRLGAVTYAEGFHAARTPLVSDIFSIR